MNPINYEYKNKNHDRIIFDNYDDPGIARYGQAKGWLYNKLGLAIKVLGEDAYSNKQKTLYLKPSSARKWVKTHLNDENACKILDRAPKYFRRILSPTSTNQAYQEQFSKWAERLLDHFLEQDNTTDFDTWIKAQPGDIEHFFWKNAQKNTQLMEDVFDNFMVNIDSQEELQVHKTLSLIDFCDKKANSGKTREILYLSVKSYFTNVLLDNYSLSLNKYESTTPLSYNEAKEYLDNFPDSANMLKKISFLRAIPIHRNTDNLPGDKEYHQLLTYLTKILQFNGDHQQDILQIIGYLASEYKIQEE